MGRAPDVGPGGGAPPRIRWPEGKTFAFSIFDDPDAQTDRDGQVVYGSLADLGFRTTRGVWPAPATARFTAPAAARDR